MYTLSESFFRMLFRDRNNSFKAEGDGTHLQSREKPAVPAPALPPPKKKSVENFMLSI